MFFAGMARAWYKISHRPHYKATMSNRPATQTLIPPCAPRKPRKLTMHGDTRIDDYFWLRKRNDPAVTDYLQAENAYAEALMADSKALQERIYQEMLARIQEDDNSVPYRFGGHYYYSRFESGQQYPLMCRKAILADGSYEGAAEQQLLDLNVLVQGKAYMSVGEFEPSQQGELLAYSCDTTGFREYTLYIKNLTTGKLLPFKRQRVSSVAWAQDGCTLFFTTEDKLTKRSNQLWRHRLGEATDTLLYEEKDERFSMDVLLTRSGAYLLAQIGSHTSSEVRFLQADTPLAAWQILAKRRANIEYDVEHHGDYFYIRCNDTGRNFRLMRTPIAMTTHQHWQEILPHRADVALESVEYFKDYSVRCERQQGLMQLLISHLPTGAEHAIRFPEPTYSLSVEPNAEWDSHLYRYNYESLTTPDSVWEYDMASGERRLLKQRPVLGDYRAQDYVSERRLVGNGTPLPVSLVYRRDTPLDGTAPIWLEGYGAYGLPNDVYFSSSRLSLLDRGFVYAVAHVRGGGDLGRTWHDAGKMGKKLNTFRDFIATAEFLLAAKIGSPQKLVIEGGSAGGMLVGAVCNMRPDLFRIAVADVPFVDVLSTMLDASLPLTVGEYEEWGNPNLKTHYAYIKRYSPYDNLKRQAYPTMLVKTSLHDSQVMYWEPAKYVAKLRTLKTDNNPLLLVTNMAAGHGGASGRYDQLKETAFDYAFVLTQLQIAS